jgi:hypothetical protein
MTDRLAPKLLEMILKNPKTKRMKKQSVKNAISRIRKNNPGVTLNASAQIFAQTKGFSFLGSLSPADRESLRNVNRPPTQTSSKPEKAAKGARKYEIQPDFESPFTKEANDNLEPYAFIYLLENGMRQVILDRFESSGSWWTDEGKVPKDVQEYAKKIEDAEQKYTWVNPRGEHPIYYVGLLELFRIIEKTWKANFKEVFPHLEDLRTWIRETVPIRNLVAHNVKTRPLQRTNVQIRTDYICRLVQKWNQKRNLC